MALAVSRTKRAHASSVGLSCAMNLLSAADRPLIGRDGAAQRRIGTGRFLQEREKPLAVSRRQHRRRLLAKTQLAFANQVSFADPHLIIADHFDNDRRAG